MARGGIRTQSPAAESLAPSPSIQGTWRVSLAPCNPAGVLGQQFHPLQVCPCLPLVQWFLEWRFLALYPSDYPFMVNSSLSMLFIHGAHWAECFETVWVL